MKLFSMHRRRAADSQEITANDSWSRRGQCAAVAADFGSLDAELHRRMMATDALLIVRRRYEQQTAADVLASASIVAVRRR